MKDHGILGSDPIDTINFLLIQLIQGIIFLKRKKERKKERKKKHAR